jgi:hypothetical protein
MLYDDIPSGSDFIGAAEALPVRLAVPAQVEPGSDFAGGTVSLTEEPERAER